jgi:hypothetical protein
MKGFSTVWPAAQLMGAMSLGQVGRVSNVAPYRAASRLTQYRVAVLGPRSGYYVAGAVAMTRYGSNAYSVSIFLQGLSEFQQYKVASFPDEVAFGAPGGTTPRLE